MNKIARTLSGVFVVIFILIVTCKFLGIGGHHDHRHHLKSYEARLHLAAIYTTQRSDKIDLQYPKTCLSKQGYDPSEEASTRDYHTGFLVPQYFNDKKLMAENIKKPCSGYNLFEAGKSHAYYRPLGKKLTDQYTFEEELGEVLFILKGHGDDKSFTTSSSSFKAIAFRKYYVNCLPDIWSIDQNKKLERISDGTCSDHSKIIIWWLPSFIYISIVFLVLAIRWIIGLKIRREVLKKIYLAMFIGFLITGFSSLGYIYYVKKTIENYNKTKPSSSKLQAIGLEHIKKYNLKVHRKESVK